MSKKVHAPLGLQGLLVLRYWRTHVQLVGRSQRVLRKSSAHMDRPLRALLAAGDVRLLRCTWLLSAESDDALGRDKDGHVIMLPKQQLLAVAPQAFFSPSEAVELLDRGDRAIFALSYAWLMKRDPDPHGWTLSAVRHFLKGPWESASAIAANVDQRWQTYLHDLDHSALFWDVRGLDLNPRPLQCRG